MRKKPISLKTAVFLLLVGIILGSIFTFGEQYWNAKVTREDCVLIETEFLDYDEVRQLKRPMEIKEIAVECANGELYFIDGVSADEQVRNILSLLNEQEKITLLIHPNSNTVVELSTEDETLLKFEDTIDKLGVEAAGFLFLGIFMYFSAFVGLYYIVLHSVRKKK